MRRWGIVITLLYALVVTLLLVPGIILLCGGDKSWHDSLQLFKEWPIRVWTVILVGGQAALLFVSVDTSWRRLKPRQHVMVSVGTTALLLGVLTTALLWSLTAGMIGDKMFDGIMGQLTNDGWKLVCWWLVFWMIWGEVFYLYMKQVPGRVVRAVEWLMKGSVLELLVAVPCHVLVRHRNDCSAPVATSFGIVTGVALMLLSFGPGVLFLYKKRLDRYEAAGSAPGDNSFAGSESRGAAS